MTVRIGNVTFDCANPEPPARFWAAVLGYTLEGADERYAACVHPKGAVRGSCSRSCPSPRR